MRRLAGRQDGQVRPLPRLLELPELQLHKKPAGVKEAAWIGDGRREIGTAQATLTALSSRSPEHDDRETVLLRPADGRLWSEPVAGSGCGGSDAVAQAGRRPASPSADGARAVDRRAGSGCNGSWRRAPWPGRAMERELYAGLDLGGTKIAAALLTGDGRVVGRARLGSRAGSGGEVVADTMVAAIVRGKCRRLASGGDRLQAECEMQAQAGHGRRPVIGHANRRQRREDLEAEAFCKATAFLDESCPKRDSCDW